MHSSSLTEKAWKVDTSFAALIGTGWSWVWAFKLFFRKAPTRKNVMYFQFLRDEMQKIVVDPHSFCVGCLFSGINSFHQGFYRQSDGVLDGSEWINKADIDLLLWVSSVAFWWWVREWDNQGEMERGRSILFAALLWGERWQAAREALTRHWIDRKQNATSWFNFSFWNDRMWSHMNSSVLTGILLVLCNSSFRTRGFTQISL